MKRIIGILALLMVLGVLGATTVSAMSHCVIAKGVKTGTNGNSNINFCSLDTQGCDFACNCCTANGIPDTIIGNDCDCQIVGMESIDNSLAISDNAADEVVAQSGAVNWVTVGIIVLAAAGVTYWLCTRKKK